MFNNVPQDAWMDFFDWDQLGELDWAAPDDAAQDRNLASVAIDVPQAQHMTALASVPSAITRSPDLQAARHSKDRSRRHHTAAFTCDYPQCSYNGIFPWKYELDRHAASQHKKDQRFECPVAGRFQRTTVTSFTRPDKLTAHLRSCHNRDTLVSCPHDGCERDLGLELMGLHLIHAHKNHGEQDKPLINAASTVYSKCPLWSCHKHVPLANFMGHVLGHKQEEIRAMAAELHNTGYLLECSTGYHASGSVDCACPISNIAIQCPVCPGAYDSHEELSRHVDLHITGEDLTGHLRGWAQYAKGLKCWKSKEAFRPYLTWRIPGFNKKALKCPCCDFTLDTDYPPWRREVDHHSSLLNDQAWLKPYRFQILRLYPDFAKHPTVWDDIAQTSDPVV